MASKREVASRFRIMILVWLTIAAWALLLVAFGVEIPAGLLKPASIMLVLLPVGLFGFEHWAWRWRWLVWLAHRPNLVGTWRGTLKSSHDDKDRDVALVVHQSYTTLHLRLLTAESSSGTLSATLTEEPDGRHVVWAVYRNEPKLKLREGSPIHRGGMQLQLAAAEQLRLTGEYWTDRGTTGSLELEHISPFEAPDYKAALELAA